jgi:hypothetical protein
MAEAVDAERENTSPKRLLLAVPSAKGAGAQKKASLLRSMNRDDDDGGGTFDLERGWRGASQGACASLEVLVVKVCEELRSWQKAGATRPLCWGDPTIPVPSGQECVDRSVKVHIVSLDAMPSASDFDASPLSGMTPAQSGCAPALPKPTSAPVDIVAEAPALPKPISAAN